MPKLCFTTPRKTYGRSGLKRWQERRYTSGKMVASYSAVILERGEFHRQAVLRLGKLFRDQPTNHRDVATDMRRHVRAADGPQCLELCFIQTKRMAAQTTPNVSASWASFCALE